MTTTTTLNNPKQRESQERTPDLHRARTGLDACYGEIGILAVAAALPYVGGNSPAKVHAEVRIDQRFIEAAA